MANFQHGPDLILLSIGAQNSIYVSSAFLNGFILVCGCNEAGSLFQNLWHRVRLDFLNTLPLDVTQ